MMKNRTSRISRIVSISMIATLAGAAVGCGSGISIFIRPQPEECFRQDVVDVDCFTRQSVVTSCEEDFFGFLHCSDDFVVDVVCEDVVVDSYLICE